MSWVGLQEHENKGSGIQAQGPKLKETQVLGEVQAQEAGMRISGG